MTNKEFDNLCFGVLLDKYGSDYFTPKERQEIMNKALLEWYRISVDEYETNSKKRIELWRYEKDKTFNNVSKVKLSELGSLYRLTAVTAVFDVKCIDDEVIRAVKPRSKDEFGRGESFYYTKCDDFEPCYLNKTENGERILDVMSETTPKVLTFFYLRNIDLIDLRVDVGLDVDDVIAREQLPPRVVRIAEKIIESQNYSNSVNVEVPLINN